MQASWQRPFHLQTTTHDQSSQRPEKCPMSNHMCDGLPRLEWVSQKRKESTHKCNSRPEASTSQQSCVTQKQALSTQQPFVKTSRVTHKQALRTQQQLTKQIKCLRRAMSSHTALSRGRQGGRCRWAVNAQNGRAGVNARQS